MRSFKKNKKNNLLLIINILQSWLWFSLSQWGAFGGEGGGGSVVPNSETKLVLFFGKTSNTSTDK